MKTKLYLPIISLLAMSVFAFISCDDSDSDTAKPVIELSEPEEGQELKIGDEHGIHFEMDLPDDVMLKSYMIEIHSNFDHHSHGKGRTATMDEATVDFDFNRFYDISGEKMAHIHYHDVIIPANATSGDYYLMVYYADAAGNEAHIVCNIILSTTTEEDDHHHDE